MVQAHKEHSLIQRKTYKRIPACKTGQAKSCWSLTPTTGWRGERQHF